MQNTNPQIKDKVECFKGKINEVEERISVLEDIICENAQTIRNMSVELSKAKETIQELSDTIKMLNIG